MCRVPSPLEGFLDRGVNEVGKLDPILKEKHRNVIADEIPVSLHGVKTYGEPAYVAGCVRRSSGAGNCRESGEDWRLNGGIAEHWRTGQILDRGGKAKYAVCARAARMHDAFRNALVIKVH
jgi:hypothetical protein